MASLIVYASLIALLCVGIALFLRYFFQQNRIKAHQFFTMKNGKESSKIVGILHPYSNGGGGGERVLWWIIRTIQSMDPNAQIVLYTGDNMENYAKKVKYVLHRITNMLGHL
jgi:hypothetical protein